MLKIIKEKHTCPVIESEVILDFQYVEIDKKQIGPKKFASCNSKDKCGLVVDYVQGIMKNNWFKCALYTKQ